jgi:hypothetical protein
LWTNVASQALHVDERRQQAEEDEKHHRGKRLQANCPTTLALLLDGFVRALFLEMKRDEFHSAEMEHVVEMLTLKPEEAPQSTAEKLQRHHAGSHIHPYWKRTRRDERQDPGHAQEEIEYNGHVVEPSRREPVQMG